MTCMASLTTIARNRSQFIPLVVQGFEALHGKLSSHSGFAIVLYLLLQRPGYDNFWWVSFAVNLPPTLSKSQVSSVRKSLKMQMLTLLKQPASYPLQTNITTLLTDLGATQSEVRYPGEISCYGSSLLILPMYELRSTCSLLSLRLWKLCQKWTRVEKGKLRSQLLHPPPRNLEQNLWVTLRPLPTWNQINQVLTSH